MRILTSRFQRVGELAYSPDGGTLYGCGSARDPQRESRVRGVDQWTLGDTAEPTVVPAPRMYVCRILPLADGQLILGGVSGSGTVLSYLAVEPTAGACESLKLTGTNGFPAVVSADGQKLYLGGLARNDGVLACFSICAAHAPRRLWTSFFGSASTRPQAWPFSLAFDPTVDCLVSAEEDKGRKLVRWRSMAGNEEFGRTPIRLPTKTSTVQFAGGARLLALAGSAIQSYDPKRPDAPPSRFMNPGRRQLSNLAVHPDGKRVFATGEDGVVRELEAETLREIRAYAWKVGKLHGMAIAPDGLTAAVGSDSGRVVVWDLE